MRNESEKSLDLVVVERNEDETEEEFIERLVKVLYERELIKAEQRKKSLN